MGNPAFLLRGTQQADVKTIDTPQKVRYFLAGFREQCCTILAVLHDISLLAYRVGGLRPAGISQHYEIFVFNCHYCRQYLNLLTNRWLFGDSMVAVVAV